MKEKFIINDIVIYHPEQHRLTPLGARGKETVLTIPASRCLLLMLQRHGVNINKEDFFSEAWGKYGQYVTPNTFYQNVSLIRKGLRNAGIMNQVIRTLPKVGLCFTGTVQVIGEEDDEPVTQIKVISEEVPDVIENGKIEHLSSKERNRTFLEKLAHSNIINFSLLNRKGIALIIKIILVIAGLSFATYNYVIYPKVNIPQRATFFGEHMHFFTVNQCDVFINKLEKNLNRDRFIQFLESKNISCNANEFLYITNSPLTIKKMIMRCQASANSSLECSTIYSFI